MRAFIRAMECYTKNTGKENIASFLTMLGKIFLEVVFANT
jgi:hypothetical protein